VFKKLFGKDKEKNQDEHLLAKTLIGKKIDAEFQPNRFNTYNYVPEEVEPKIEELPDEPLDILFAKNYTEKGGRFIYCEDKSQLFEKLKLFISKFQKNKMLIWEESLIDYLRNQNFFDAQFTYDRFGENSDISLSFCSGLIAKEGHIVLSPIQNNPRSNDKFPEFEIIIASKEQIFHNTDAAVAQYCKEHESNPYVIQLEENPTLIRNVNNRLLLNSKRTQNITNRMVFLFYCDSVL
jgi:L-lactate utilization protein LutC